MNVSRETSDRSFLIVALDGPSGVGKSSTGQALAKNLGFCFLSSGQVYRGLTWWALKKGWQPGEGSPDEMIRDAQVSVGEEKGLSINDQFPGDALSSEQLSQATSVFSANPEVREHANRILRDAVARLSKSGWYNGVILEGRDIGTVVFQDADRKIFLTANPQVRAERRFLERASLEEGLTLEQVRDALLARDERDKTRDVAPLTAAEDAFQLDNSTLLLEEVTEQLSDYIRSGRIRH